MSRWRRALIVAGLLPAVLVLAFTAKVVLMVLNEQQGRGDFGDDAFAAAAEQFGANRSLNLLEPWIAHFDEGAALHADGRLRDAVGRYTDALEDVPVEEECTVRINLALAHEALGDAALRQPQPDLAAAIAEYEAGIAALAEGGCPQDSGRGEEQTRDAVVVDERLREKLQQSEQQQEQQRKDDRKQEQQREDEQQPEQERPDPRERELQRRNDRALQERREYEELFKDRDYGSEYEW